MDMGNRGILLDTAGRRNKELGTRNKKYIDYWILRRRAESFELDDLVFRYVMHDIQNKHNQLQYHIIYHIHRKKIIYTGCGNPWWLWIFWSGGNKDRRYLQYIISRLKSFANWETKACLGPDWVLIFLLLYRICDNLQSQPHPWSVSQFRLGSSTTASRTTIPDPSSTLPDSFAPGTLLPLQNVLQSELPLPVPNIMMDLSSPIRSVVRLSFPSLLLGCVRIGFFPSLPDSATAELSLTSHSFAHVGSLPLALDLASADTFTLLQSFAQSGFSSPVMGSVGIGSSLLAMDFLGPDPIVLLHSFSHTGSSLVIVGLACSALLLFVLDMSSLDLFPLPHGLMCLEIALLICGLSWFELQLSTLGYSCLGMSLLCRGLIRSSLSLLALGTQNLDILPSALDAAMTDSVLSLQSSVRTEVPVFACSFQQHGSSLLPQSFCHSGFLLSMANLSHTDLLLLAKSFAYPGAALSVLDTCDAGSPAFVRSLFQIDLASFASSFANVDASMPSKSSSCLGLLLFVVGCVRCGVTLPVPDVSSMGSVPFSRSFLRSELVLVALSGSSLDLSLLPRSLAHAELPSLTAGLRMDFPPFVLDVSILELLLSLQSLS